MTEPRFVPASVSFALLLAVCAVLVGCVGCVGCGGGDAPERVVPEGMVRERPKKVSEMKPGDSGRIWTIVMRSDRKAFAWKTSEVGGFGGLPITRDKDGVYWVTVPSTFSVSPNEDFRRYDPFWWVFVVPVCVKVQP